MEEMDKNYNEVICFLDGIEGNIKHNFENLDYNLKDKYKDLSYKIDKIKNKHNFYIKNLRKVEEAYKSDNRFDKLNSDLEFFKNYSSILDNDIENIQGKIVKEKEVISKKKKLVIQYRNMIKSKIKKNLVYENFLETVERNYEKKEEEKNEEDRPEKHDWRFFMTENGDALKRKRINKVAAIRNSNLQQSFNFFKECLNAYFKGFYNNTKTSNNENKFKMILLDVLDRIVKNNLNSKKNMSCDILDIIQNKLFIPIDPVKIDKGSQSFALLFKGIENPIDQDELEGMCEGNDLKMEKIPLTVFSNFTDQQIFLLILHKIHILNVMLIEWQQSISINYKRIKKPIS